MVIVDFSGCGWTQQGDLRTVTEIKPTITRLTAALPLRRPVIWLPVLIAVIAGLTIGLCQRETRIPDALLDVVRGQVEVFSGPELALNVVSDEAELGRGDRIRVLEDSQAAVVFFEGSVVLLDSGTDITVEQLAGDRELGVSNIAIFQGVGRSVHRVSKLVDAESSYAVRTRSSVGLVRGTGFVVEEDPVKGTKWKSFEGGGWRSRGDGH